MQGYQRRKLKFDCSLSTRRFNTSILTIIPSGRLSEFFLQEFKVAISMIFLLAAMANITAARKKAKLNLYKSGSDTIHDMVLL